MECVSVVEARHVTDYRVFILFNTGEMGEVDLRDMVYRYRAAEPLRDPAVFARFHLDSWPTLVWECGFDVDPELLYFRAIGKSLLESPTIVAPKRLAPKKEEAEGQNSVSHSTND